MNTCKHCGCMNLHWKQVEGRWRLFYESGQPHLCIATRSTLAKSIPKPAKSFWDEKELAKWEKRQPVVPPMPQEWSEEWFLWLCLDEGAMRPKLARVEIARQGELIP